MIQRQAFEKAVRNRMRAVKAPATEVVKGQEYNRLAAVLHRYEQQVAYNNFNAFVDHLKQEIASHRSMNLTRGIEQADRFLGSLVN